MLQIKATSNRGQEVEPSSVHGGDRGR